jgi:hypothetical protein
MRMAYRPQEPQFPELQPEQALPPTGAEDPCPSFEKQANLDRTGSDLVWQEGQVAPWPYWLIGRRSSNFFLHLGQ